MLEGSAAWGPVGGWPTAWLGAPVGLARFSTERMVRACGLFWLGSLV